MTERVFEFNENILGLKESSTLAINQTAKDMRARGETVYHFGFGQSPFPVPEKIQNALRDHAGCKDYLPTLGLPELRKEIAVFLKRESGQEFSPENILIGPGSKELLFQALYVFEGLVLIPAPSWVSYKPQVDIKNARTRIIQTQKENNYKLSASELDEYCQGLSNNQKILILNSPNNPTGAVYFESEVRELATVCEKHNIVLIADEIYSLINYAQEDFFSFSRAYPQGTIVTGGLSKIFSAGGYRLGFMALPDSMVSAIKPLKAMFSETFSSVSAPIQFAAIAAYKKDPEIKSYIDTCVKIHKASGEYLFKRFTEMGLHSSTPQGSFYLFLDFENFRDQFRKVGIHTGSQLADVLLQKASFALLPGKDFYMPAQSLTARVSTVDYDGKLCLNAANNGQDINQSFIEKNCPNIKLGADSLENFLVTLK